MIHQRPSLTSDTNTRSPLISPIFIRFFKTLSSYFETQMERRTLYRAGRRRELGGLACRGADVIAAVGPCFVSSSGTTTTMLYVLVLLRPGRPQTARAAPVQLVHTTVVLIKPSPPLHQNHISSTIHESMEHHTPVSTTVVGIGR